MARYMLASEAGARLGYTSVHVRRLVRSGALTGEQVGSIWIIERASVEGYNRPKRGRAGR